jgi:hypothetical protein
VCCLKFHSVPRIFQTEQGVGLTRETCSTDGRSDSWCDVVCTGWCVPAFRRLKIEAVCSSNMLPLRCYLRGVLLRRTSSSEVENWNVKRFINFLSVAPTTYRGNSENLAQVHPFSSRASNLAPPEHQGTLSFAVSGIVDLAEVSHRGASVATGMGAVI